MGGYFNLHIKRLEYKCREKTYGLTLGYSRKFAYQYNSVHAKRIFLYILQQTI